MTPHIEAKLGEIAKTVIMPGDPKRATFIAQNYLENARLVNEVRGIYAYTGTYKGKEVTVMASGMGCPSMGIYSYELFKFYDVENIIRIGSCGAYKKDLELYDLILVRECFSESTYAKMQNGDERNVLPSSDKLNEIIREKALEKSFHLTEGRVYSSDVFYGEVVNPSTMYDEKGCLAVEMETFALFHNALALGKNATAVLTVSDNIITGAETTSLEREKSFTKMMELVLDSIV